MLTIINAKLSQAHQYAIQTSCAVSTSGETIDGIDICNLIGNLLDNAIEACMKLPSGEAEIFLEIRNAPGKILVLVKNTVTESVLSNNTSLVTDKENKQEHDIGLQTVRSPTISRFMTESEIRQRILKIIRSTMPILLPIPTEI